MQINGGKVGKRGRGEKKIEGNVQRNRIDVTENYE